MRNRRHILDQLDVQTSSLQRSDRTFTPRPGPLNPNLNVAHPKLGGFLRRLLSRTLTSKWRALTTPLEPGSTSGRPTKRISARIRNRHRRVIEGAVDVNNPTANVPTNTLFLVCFCHRCHRHLRFGGGSKSPRRWQFEGASPRLLVAVLLSRG